MGKVSKAAIELIVAEEVSSRALYEKLYRSTEWPGASSGVTIGIGYDVGQNTQAQLRKDWSGVIPDRMIDALAPTCGVTGPAAKPHAARLKGVIDVPWDAALQVFERCSLPRYLALTERALPNTDKLSPDSLGALVSLVFNRGASFAMQEDRYREMRAIKAHMASGAFERIPGELRAMKRLWPTLPGLLRRRDREAELFTRGLKIAPVPQPVPVPAEPPPVPTPVPLPPKKPGNVPRDTTTGTVVGGGLVAGVVAFVKANIETAAAIVILAVVAGVLIHKFWPRKK